MGRKKEIAPGVSPRKTPRDTTSTAQHDGTKNKSYGTSLEVTPTENQNNNKVIDSDENLEKKHGIVEDTDLQQDSESEREETKNKVEDEDDQTDIDEKIRILMERKRKRLGKIGEHEEKISNVDVDTQVQEGIQKIKQRVLEDTAEDSSSLSSEDEDLDKHFNALLEEAKIERSRAKKKSSVLSSDLKQRKQERKNAKKEEYLESLEAKRKKIKYQKYLLDCSSSEDDFAELVKAHQNKKKRKAAKRKAELLKQLAELEDSDVEITPSPIKRKKYTKKVSKVGSSSRPDTILDEEKDLLEKLRKIREKKDDEEFSEYGPTKPARMIDENAFLFNSTDVLQHSKLASSVEDKLKEGEAFSDTSGMIIGSATI
ncbi:MAG: hypothetical protein GY705_31970, partial [Bacteroidetes bacterium]|nr:hypothetical protein [Bacteroidota bacterium]